VSYFNTRNHNEEVLGLEEAVFCQESGHAGRVCGENDPFSFYGHYSSRSGAQRKE
jgi:hypothetical protein